MVNFSLFSTLFSCFSDHASHSISARWETVPPPSLVVIPVESKTLNCRPLCFSTLEALSHTDRCLCASTHKPAPPKNPAAFPEKPFVRCRCWVEFAQWERHTFYPFLFFCVFLFFLKVWSVFSPFSCRKKKRLHCLVFLLRQWCENKTQFTDSTSKTMSVKTQLDTHTCTHTRSHTHTRDHIRTLQFKRLLFYMQTEL